jgi:hypothetical protein
MEAVIVAFHAFAVAVSRLRPRETLFAFEKSSEETFVLETLSPYAR